MEAAVPNRVESAHSLSGGPICHRAARAEDRFRSKRTLPGIMAVSTRRSFRVPPPIVSLLMGRQIAGLATEIGRQARD